MGKVVKIISKQHKYFGHEAVVLMRTPKMFFVRLVDLEKPIYSRFTISRNKISSVSSPYIFMYIKPSSVQEIKGKNIKANPNDWHKETLMILDKYGNMSVQDVEKKIGHKLVPWEK